MTKLLVWHMIKSLHHLHEEQRQSYAPLDELKNNFLTHPLEHNCVYVPYAHDITFKLIQRGITLFLFLMQVM